MDLGSKTVKALYPAQFKLFKALMALSAAELEVLHAIALGNNDTDQALTIGWAVSDLYLADDSFKHASKRICEAQELHFAQLYKKEHP